MGSCARALGWRADARAEYTQAAAVAPHPCTGVCTRHTQPHTRVPAARAAPARAIAHACVRQPGRGADAAALRGGRGRMNQRGPVSHRRRRGERRPGRAARGHRARTDGPRGRRCRCHRPFRRRGLVLRASGGAGPLREPFPPLRGRGFASRPGALPPAGSGCCHGNGSGTGGPGLFGALWKRLGSPWGGLGPRRGLGSPRRVGPPPWGPRGLLRPARGGEMPHRGGEGAGARAGQPVAAALSSRRPHTSRSCLGPTGTWRTR